jgi:hypothetical protein
VATSASRAASNPRNSRIKNMKHLLLVVMAVSMRVCYDLPGKEFPKDFKAPKGTQLYAVGYRRQKEK